MKIKGVSTKTANGKERVASATLVLLIYQPLVSTKLDCNIYMDVALTIESVFGQSFQGPTVVGDVPVQLTPWV
eukprot:4196508-Amphidinium_carterae.1